MNIPCNWSVISSIPGGAITSNDGIVALTSISISLPSSLPSLRSFLSACLVSLVSLFVSTVMLKLSSRLGSNISRIFSSANSSDLWLTLVIALDLTWLIEISVKSLIIESTSLPTYPTSVNLVASTFIKGACARCANLLAISVFPTPVGPIIKIFFGVISLLISSSNWSLLHRFLRAIATALFASD